jgi:hypothetical protein
MIFPQDPVHLAFSLSIRDEGVSHNQIFRATPCPFVILNKHLGSIHSKLYYPAVLVRCARGCVFVLFIFVENTCYVVAFLM